MTYFTYMQAYIHTYMYIHTSYLRAYMGQNFERCTIGHFQILSTSTGSPPVTQKPFLCCRRKEYKQGFQETYTLYTFTNFCTSHGPPNAKKNDKKLCFYTFSFFRNHPVNFQATLPILSNYSVNLVCLGPVS